MKHYYLKALTLLSCLLFGITAHAHDFEAQNSDGVTIYYNITSSANKTCEVTYKGSDYNEYSYEYNGNITIPKSVTYNSTTYSVTSIADNTFYYCNGLTSITFPNNITSIGRSIFEYCTNLTSIVVESGNRKYDSRNNSNAIIETSTNILIYGCKNTVIPNSVTNIGESAFDGCSGLTSITIPNSVTSIGNYAFNFCSGLTSITIPNSVTNIGEAAFSGCTSLTSVTIPNSVTSIGEMAFSFYTNLTSIVVESGNTKYDSRNNCNAIIETKTNTLITGCKNTIIPNSVTSIGGHAFYACTDLSIITIPNSVTNIGAAAFSDCTGLTSITIPNSVTHIGVDAFYNTGWYNNQPDGILYLSNCCLGYKGNKPTGNLSIKDGTRLIPSSYAFEGCTGLTSVTIPNSVTNIGMYAFKGCTGLTSVTIPNSVTSIGNYAFNNCFGLTSVTIPNSVTNIGKSAFQNCTGLTSATIPNSVTSIGYLAFSDCTGLTSVEFNAENCTEMDRAFIGCTSLTNITIGVNVTTIPYHAFYNCRGLTSITIPNSVTHIGLDAFEDCTGLTKVNITDLEAWCKIDFIIGSSNPLYYAKQLYLKDELITDIKIPNTITEIKEYAFYNCSNLTSVEIPNSVTTIGMCAFEGCTSIKELRIEDGESTLSLEYNNYSTSGIGEGLFYDCPLETLYLGRNIKYSTTYPYTEYPERYGYSAFYNKTTLKSVTIGNSVTSIGNYAFSYCKSLTNIEIPNSITSIGESAFSYCSGLTSIVVDSQNIEYDSRNNCNAIIKTSTNTLIAGCKNTTIPNNVTSISNFAFGGCTNLNNVTIPSSVTSIGNFAFDDCDGLTSIECNAKTPPILGDNAFSSTSAILKVPFTHYYNYKETDIWKDFDFAKYEVDGICYLPTKEQDAMVTSNENAYIGNVVIPNEVVIDDATYSVTQIGESAFKDCTKLINLAISENITKINDYAFYGDKSIRTITCNAITPPTCGTDVFNSVKTDAVILTVPQESILLYQTADVWFDFWNIVGGVTTGIEETLANDTEGTEYYNLQGVRVVNPERGLYIKRQGGKTTKVVL